MEAVRRAALLLLLCASSIASAQDLNAALVEAVKKGSVADVQRLLAAGASANAASADGFPVLGTSIMEHHLEITELLLKAGANANATAGGTAMSALADLSANDKAKELLARHGGQASSRETAQLALHNLGYPANPKGFYAAIKEDRTDAVDLFLKVFDLHFDLFQGNTPLHVASFEGALKVAELLVARGANVNARNQKGVPVLWYATQRKHEAVRTFLVSRGARID